MSHSDITHSPLRNSIVQHTTLAFILVIGVTLCSMLGGMYMADSIQGDAEALNKAGSLRMQSYRLTLLALENEEQLLQEHIAKFEQTLLDYSLARAIGNDPASTLHRLYGKAVERWRDSMLPLLQNQPRQIRAFRAEVPVFVNELDQFVHALQVKSEGKLAVIRGLQIGTLLFTVLMAFFVLLGVYSNLITPLRELTRLAQQIGRGDFRSKAYYEARNELGLLARAFNKMSDELADLYDHLERKVDEKTAQLQRSNNSLELLFNSARSLYRSSADPIPELASLLLPVQRSLGSGPVSLCLNHASQKTCFSAHTAVSAERQPPHYCRLPDCEQCPVHAGDGKLAGGTELINFALRSGNSELGTLRVEQPQGVALEPWQEQLLRAVAELFAASLGLSQLGQQQARLALMEERAVIARELHDSLAQALSYQKLQLSRYKKQIASGHPKAELDATLAEIQDGLNAAYRQLRELLTTFRIKLDMPGLAAAVRTTVLEFSSHSGVDICLRYALEHCPLSPNEEIHCLQIIREALSNVIKHAQAARCDLWLHQDKHGLVHICVDDDGIGIDVNKSPNGHYGLSILAERAGSLHGRLKIGPRREGGTQVHLQFLPAYRRIPLQQEIETT
ncbi:histidine kinase [Stutzerimonas nitrititolerans]|uniref:histidine kinase n=1 Tax=Stutzerimonas nitrititolerans TaxID=2482751 RepID=UPI0028AC8274|nr:histidine kinase [Stutzerimonas nitrititolerans]